MGYSCEANADLILSAISKKCIEMTKHQNEWNYKNRRFFYEIGMERKDGSITGSILELINNSAIKRSSFKIEAVTGIPKGSYGFADLLDIPEFEEIRINQFVN